MPIVFIWSRNGAWTPFVAVAGGALGAFLFSLVMPYSWLDWLSSSGVDVALYVVVICWSAAFAHLYFQLWLEERDYLEGSSFFFIPTEVWTGLLFLGPLFVLLWSILTWIF